MTTIKKMHLHGFKSFAKPIDLDFGNNFNVILGPNGSGKSNVMDALCFVLGKSSAKSMRAEKSANLIYNGGKTGGPLKEAEVSLFFDNSTKEFPLPSDLVKISRIVRQNGQSIYKINDEVKIRQEVLELLNTVKIDPYGHNIILQGDIIRFMEMHPEDRRLIIEEAAGISVYEEKKIKALSELQKVDQKLNEANIILTERKTYLRELKKERDQAVQFKELEEKIKSNRATYLHLQINEREDKGSQIAKQTEANNSEIDKLNQKILESQTQITELKKELEDTNNLIETKGEKEQIELQKELEKLRTDLVRDKTRKESCELEIKKIKERALQLELNLKEIESKINFIIKEKEHLKLGLESERKKDKELTEEINQFKQSHGLTQNKELESLELGIDAKQNHLLQLKEEQSKLQNELYRLDIEVKKFDSIQNVNKEFDYSKKKEELTAKTIILKSKREEDSLISGRINTNNKNLSLIQEKLAKLRAKQIYIKESISGNLALDKILALKQKGIYGTVSDLGRVESKYSLALDIAAGGKIHSLVVESDKIAADCINFLKEKKLGVVTFLPLNKMSSKPASLQKYKDANGVHGLAIDLIKYDSKFKDVFYYVFGPTLVVDDINIARKIGVGNARMVTLDGDLFELSGAIIGGFRRKRAGSFKQEELETESSSLEKELEEVKSTLSVLENKKRTVEQEISELRNKNSILEGELLKFENTIGIKDLSRIEEQYVSLIKDKQHFTSQLANLNKNIDNLTTDLTNLKTEKEKIKSKSLSSTSGEDKLKKIEDEREKIKATIVRSETQIKSIDDQIITIHKPENERVIKIIKQNSKDLEDFNKELDNLVKLIKERDSVLTEKSSQEKEFYNEYKNLFKKRNTITEDIQKLGYKISTENTKIRDFENKINDLSLKRAKIIAELEGLNLEFEQFKEVKLRKNIPIEELKLEISNYERSLKNMGNVNLKALEVYVDIEKEYDLLLEKAKVMETEKTDILTLMGEIEKKKKSIFMKTFNKIADNFKTIFASLSEKGEAHLELENKEDPLIAGLDVKVRLVGSKYLDLKSLSGGEKTLAALAFIFAIQEYKPASFYLLDEVDAALDKTNTILLAKLIKKYSDSAQYILISHNDYMISEADQIYGVSMQKNGISKVISLRI